MLEQGLLTSCNPCHLCTWLKSNKTTIYKQLQRILHESQHKRMHAHKTVACAISTLQEHARVPFVYQNKCTFHDCTFLLGAANLLILGSTTEAATMALCLRNTHMLTAAALPRPWLSATLLWQLTCHLSQLQGAPQECAAPCSLLCLPILQEPVRHLTQQREAVEGSNIAEHRDLCAAH